jgi:hypothetical protein
MEPPASKEGFKMQEQMKITWRYVWAVGGMNFSRFYVLRIQETDYRPHFTCGGILYFLEHYKHTAQSVNTV